jgi:hypothetical protein
MNGLLKCLLSQKTEAFGQGLWMYFQVGFFVIFFFVKSIVVSNHNKIIINFKKLLIHDLHMSPHGRHSCTLGGMCGASQRFKLPDRHIVRHVNISSFIWCSVCLQRLMVCHWQPPPKKNADKSFLFLVLVLWFFFIFYFCPWLFNMSLISFQFSY